MLGGQKSFLHVSFLVALDCLLILPSYLAVSLPRVEYQVCAHSAGLWDLGSMLARRAPTSCILDVALSLGCDLGL